MPGARTGRRAAKPTAATFTKRLKAMRSDEQREQLQRYFKTGKGEYGEGDIFIGVQMGKVFKVAKEFIEMDPGEIEKLLGNKIHEVRAGGLSIMNQQARRKRTPESRRKELYDLYLRRHDGINNWDLVDVAAPHVIGGYLYEYGKPRRVLYKLARSRNLWERRTGIVATLYFVSKDDLDDAFEIAEVLLNDRHDLIHKAVGWVLRTAGTKDRKRLLAFLDRHAATMPRTALRASMEHLPKTQRQHYMGLAKKISGGRGRRSGGRASRRE